MIYCVTFLILKITLFFIKLVTSIPRPIFQVETSLLFLILWNTPHMFISSTVIGNWDEISIYEILLVYFRCKIFRQIRSNDNEISCLTRYWMTRQRTYRESWYWGGLRVRLRASVVIELQSRITLSEFLEEDILLTW